MLYSGGTLTAIDQGVTPNDYGDRNPLISPGGVWMPNGGIPLLEAHATYSAIYSRQQWISTLVDKVADATARLPFKTFRPSGKGRIKTGGSPYGQLMRAPCPRHGRVFLWNWTAATLEINGESMWIKVRNPATKLPVALWPMHPANLDVRKRPGGGLEYVWRTRAADGSEIAWGEEDVVHFKRYNPDSIYRGQSRLESLRRSILAEEAVQVAQESWWRGGARPSVLLRHPKTLSEPAAARLRAQWEDLHGGARKWGRTAVLEEGVEAQIVQLSAQEMQMIDSRKISREEACGRYDVPPPAVHILDRATFSNITEQLRSLYRDTMGARLALYESVIGEQLSTEFGDRDYGKFLLDEVLRGDFEKRMTAYAQGIYYGVYKPSEVRAMEELPDAGEEADQLYMSGAMVPLRISATGATISGPAGDAGRAGAGTAKGIRSALGRLSRAASLDDVNLAAVTRGLDEVTAGVVAVHLSQAVSRGDDLGGLRAALADEARAASEHEQEEVA